MGCCHRTPQPGWLANTNLFLAVLEAEKSEIKTQEKSVPGDCLLALSSHDGRGKGAPWGLLQEGTNPICEGSTFITHPPPTGPPLHSPSHWVFGFNMWIWGGDTNIQSIATLPNREPPKHFINYCYNVFYSNFSWSKVKSRPTHCIYLSCLFRLLS